MKTLKTIFRVFRNIIATLPLFLAFIFLIIGYVISTSEKRIRLFDYFDN